MRSFYLLCLLVAAGLGRAWAQPAISSRYVRAEPLTLTLNFGDGSLVPVTTGANQTWTFRVPSTSEEQYIAEAFTASAGTPFLAAANFALGPVATPSERDYYQVDATGIRLVGLAGDGYAFFRPAVRILQSGQAYGSPIYSTFIRVDTTYPGAPDPTSYQRFTDTLTYAGYGTLTLNGTTYRDVSLVTLHRLSESGPSPAGPWSPFTRWRYSMWWAPGYGYPLLQRTIRRLGTLTLDYANFLTDVATANQSAVHQTGLTLWPQPATDVVRVALPDQTPAAGKATVRNAAGAQIAELDLFQGQAHISGLAPGFYWLEVPHQGRLLRCGFVKQ